MGRIKHRRRDGPLAISRQLLADWVGVHPSVVSRAAAEHEWPETGRAIDLVQLIAVWWRELADLRGERAILRRQAAAATPSAKDEDELLAGEDTPALERYRAVRAAQELLKLEQMRGSLIDLAELEEDLELINRRLRQAAEQLQRAYGREAGELLVEALDEAFLELRGRLAPHHATAGALPDASE